MSPTARRAVRSAVVRAASLTKRSPHLVEQLALRDHTVPVLDQEAQQVQGPGFDVHRFPGPTELVPCNVQLEFPETILVPLHRCSVQPRSGGVHMNDSPVHRPRLTGAEVLVWAGAASCVAVDAAGAGWLMQRTTRGHTAVATRQEVRVPRRRGHAGSACPLATVNGPTTRQRLSVVGLAEYLPERRVVTQCAWWGSFHSSAAGSRRRSVGRISSRGKAMCCPSAPSRMSTPCRFGRPALWTCDLRRRIC